MKQRSVNIIGIWHNKSRSEVFVAVNGNQDPIRLPPQGTSFPSEMQLSDLMILSVTLSSADAETSEPMLLWEDPAGSPKAILQQTARYESWERLDVFALDPGALVYKFNINESDADGLLIVGTVELVDPELLRRAASHRI